MLKNEKIFYILLATLIIFSFYLRYTLNLNLSDKIIILSNGNIRKIDLNINKTYIINGKIGKSILKVKDRKFWLESSPCKEKICIRSGKLEKGSIICVPQRIRIYRPVKAEIDAITY